MTMLSFRVAEAEADAVRTWAKRTGVEQSTLLRDAVHHHLVRLKSERDATSWEQTPPTEAEQTLAQIADWGPAEDWSDWADATE